MHLITSRSSRTCRRMMITCLAVSLLAGGCRWTSYGFDDSNSRNNRAETRLGVDNVGQLEVAWRYDGVVGVTSTPAEWRDSVYFGAWDGALRSLDTRTGALRWQTQLTTRSIDDSPLVHDGLVYTGAADGSLYAVDAETGELRWSTRLDPHPATQIFSSPVEVDGKIVVGVASVELAFSLSDYTFRGSIVALDEKTGEEVWRTYITNDDANGGAGGSVWSSAAIDRGRGLLFIGAGQSYEEPASPLTDSLLALDYRTGALAWKRQFTAGDVFTFWNASGPDADIGAAPNLFTIDGRDVVGVGDKAGHYAVFDRDTGETIWTIELPQGNRLGGIMTTAAYADGVIYVSSTRWGTNILDFHDPAHASATYALDAATGAIIWHTDLPSPAFNAISYANGVVYQTTVKGTMYALDGTTGAVLYSDAPGADLGGGVSIRGGTVFVGYGFWFIAAPPNPVGGLVAYRVPR
jgi:polyvinyl alcohol dehydrogenase (cytochrome)